MAALLAETDPRWLLVIIAPIVKIGFVIFAFMSFYAARSWWSDGQKLPDDEYPYLLREKIWKPNRRNQDLDKIRWHLAIPLAIAILAVGGLIVMRPFG